MRFSPTARQASAQPKISRTVAPGMPEADQLFRLLRSIRAVRLGRADLPSPAPRPRRSDTCRYSISSHAQAGDPVPGPRSGRARVEGAGVGEALVRAAIAGGTSRTRARRTGVRAYGHTGIRAMGPDEAATGHDAGASLVSASAGRRPPRRGTRGTAKRRGIENGSQDRVAPGPERRRRPNRPRSPCRPAMASSRNRAVDVRPGTSRPGT
jgi:hypothetical protein